MIDYNLLIDRFLEIENVIGDPQEGYKYEAINHFQNNWNLDEQDFHQMFRNAFARRDNLFYQNSWGFIDKCAKHFPDFTKLMFIDLYSETEDLETRIRNFQNKSEELLEKLKTQLQRENFNAQQDERTISVYLSFRYPEKYIFYMYSFYSKLKAEFTVNIKSGERNNYLELLRLLPEFKSVVKSREDFIDAYRHYFPKQDWDDINLMMQNILFVGYRDDLSGIYDGSLSHFSTHELKNYYDFLSTVISKLGLQKGDNRLVFNQSKKQLNFTVGQKYVWCLKEEKKQNRYLAISDLQFGKNIEVFESENNKFLNDTNDYDLILKNSESIFKSIGEELQKTKKSGYYKHNSAFFERMAFEEDFRNLILDKVLSEINFYPYKVLEDYKDWYLQTYGEELLELHYAMIIGCLFQLEKYNEFTRNQLNHYDVKTVKHLKNRILNFNYEGLDVFEKFLDHIIKNTKMNTIPLNQILYGPPGTGKTYNTINEAISIANPEFDLAQKRAIVKIEYDRLVEEGQIVFTTFHQSMSNEDFIEGIKPVMNEDEGELSYEVQNGIFKDICKNAGEIEEAIVVDNFDESWERLIELVKEKIADEKLLKIGSWEYGLSSKESLKYSSLNSPSQYTFTITKQNIQDAYQNKQARPSGAFQKDMGDIVQFMKESFGLPGYEQGKEKFTSQRSNKNFVLIIDEINRGNVSQIFGELITLIEEGKRIGNSEELKVTLPYSKKEFGVPSNLYIIGTMNTADRSVEALDTALRRRFSFVEMMPDVSVVEKEVFSDNFQRAEIMQRINNRIELLLDRNYTLGHSYFIKEDFKSSFQNEIIPLLQEYFYNDCSKIGLILGIGFVREKEISKSSQKNVFADFYTRSEIDIVKSYELIPFEEVVFENAINLLLI